MNSERPRILLTNDDGYHADGIVALEAGLAEIGDVYVVAPESEMSGASHSLTLSRPLRIRQRSDRHWTVDGTPTDCVNLAVLSLLKGKRPDIVVSGINFGPNLGDDVTYSGTISAAFEGALLNIPSIAFSSLVGEHFTFDRAAAFAAEMTRVFLQEKRDPGIILNVNFPVHFTGVKVTCLGKRVYSEGVIERRDPRGRKYYWIGGDEPTWLGGENTDFEAVQQGFISITPLHLDLTHHPSIPKLKPLEEILGHFAKA